MFIEHDTVSTYTFPLVQPNGDCEAGETADSELRRATCAWSSGPVPAPVRHQHHSFPTLSVTSHMQRTLGMKWERFTIAVFSCICFYFCKQEIYLNVISLGKLPNTQILGESRIHNRGRRP